MPSNSLCTVSFREPYYVPQIARKTYRIKHAKIWQFHQNYKDFGSNNGHEAKGVFQLPIKTRPGMRHLHHEELRISYCDIRGISAPRNC